MGRQTVIIDSSGLAEFGDCPRKYELTNIEQLTPSVNVREDFAMGTYGHKLLEIYYQNFHLNTNDRLKKVYDFQPAPDFPLSKEKRIAVEDKFKVYWMTYLQNDIIPDCIPQEILIEYPNYSYKHGAWRIDTKQIPLVEQGFSYPVLDTKEYLFVLEGKIDVLGTLGGMPCFMDHKWQGRENKLYIKKIQFRNYALASGRRLCIVNYIRLHKGVNDNTFVRDVVSFNDRDIEYYWRQELIEMFIKVAKARLNGYDKQRSSCDGKYGYPCHFTKICDEYNENIVVNIKNTQYVKKEQWRPW